MEDAYVAHYGEAFPEPTRFGDYDKTIDDEDTAVIPARTESAHKTKRAECATSFVLAAVADT